MHRTFTHALGIGTLILAGGAFAASHEDGSMAEDGAHKSHGSIHDEHAEHGQGMKMAKMWKNVDADGNGTISEQEYLDAKKKSFAKMDADGNGELTQEEVKSHYKEKREMRHNGMQDKPAQGAGGS